MKVHYFKNKKTNEFCALQLDGSVILVCPDKNAICNPTNYHVFMSSEDVYYFEKTISKRNNLEEIRPEEFNKALDLTYSNITSISSGFKPIKESKERAAYMGTLTPSTDKIY